MTLFRCTLPGRVAIKKNSTQRKYSFARKRTVTMPSDRYCAWANSMIPYLHRARGTLSTITCLLEARYKFYFENHKNEPDVSNCIEGPQDLLQRTGIIEDDKLIVRVIAEKFFGEEPRCEIELQEIA